MKHGIINNEKPYPLYTFNIHEYDGGYCGEN